MVWGLVWPGSVTSDVGELMDPSPRKGKRKKKGKRVERDGPKIKTVEKQTNLLNKISEC